MMLKIPSLVKLLKLCVDTKWLLFGKAIHAQLLIHNHSHISLLNSLIHFYLKCDQLHLSRIMFDKMPLRNVVSWNALMAGHLHRGDHLQLLLLFKNLLSLPNGVRPNEYVFTTILSACSHSGRVLEGMQCHCYLFKSGFVSHQYVKSALVHVYSRCFLVESALQVLDTVPAGGHDNDIEIFSYNSVLNALVESGRWGEAVQVLGRMVDECVVWDSVTYVSVMGLCAHMQVHAQLLRGGLMYGKCSEVLDARKVFDGLQNRNVVVWTALMTAYLQNGYFEETLNLFTCMDKEDTLPNEYTFAVLLNACAGIAALRHGDLLHARLEKLGFQNHVIVRNSLINMYSKSGSIGSSYNVFFDMTYRDIITWNAVICGFSHHGLGKQALLVFQDMVFAGECPNYVTFIGVLSACAHLLLESANEKL